jgi:hypothetical protein
MTAALHLLLQLLPAAPAPAALVTKSWVDWAAIREQTSAGHDTTQPRRRTGAIEYSNGYYTRLKIHRVLSFAMLPLFAGSFITGDQIIRKGDDAPGWARSLHKPLAAGTAVVFGANTITGVWNLWDSRKDPAGRAKRYIHSILFIAAGAGFVYAASKAEDESAAGGGSQNHAHRNIALASMGISVSSWALMLFFK